MSIENQYSFNCSVIKDGLENTGCLLLWVMNRNWDILFESYIRIVYVTSVVMPVKQEGVPQNAGSPSLGYISVNNLKWNIADQGRCLCFLGSLHSDKCRLKFIEKRLDLKIIQNILSKWCGIVQIWSGLWHSFSSYNTSE